MWRSEKEAPRSKPAVKPCQRRDRSHEWIDTLCASAVFQGKLLDKPNLFEPPPTCRDQLPAAEVVRACPKVLEVHVGDLAPREAVLEPVSNSKPGPQRKPPTGLDDVCERHPHMRLARRPARREEMETDRARLEDATDLAERDIVILDVLEDLVRHHEIEGRVRKGQPVRPLDQIQPLIRPVQNNIAAERIGTGHAPRRHGVAIPAPKIEDARSGGQRTANIGGYGAEEVDQPPLLPCTIHAAGEC